jgi:hypothetical protein
MKRIALASCLLFASACGAPSATDATVAQLRAAVPTRATLSIVPAATQAVTPAPDGGPACAALRPSQFGTLTHQIAGNADGVIGGVLGTVEAITKGAPVASSPGHAVWGPLPSPDGSVVHRLAVDAVGANEFHFVLAGKLASADESAWQGLFQGVTTAPDATHRAGQLAVDFGAIHALDPTSDPIAGGVAVHFEAADPARNVNASFSGIQGASAPAPDDAAYAFQLAPDQSAGLAFSTRVDFDGSGALDELAHIDSRWAPTGAGVAHLTVSGGSLGTGGATAVECWDSTLARVFFTDSVGHNEGDPACCPN